MRYLAFELSMPNVGSWNRKWTGEKDLHCLVFSYQSGKANNVVVDNILKTNYHYYNFGDGWSAGISIREVDAYEARSLRRRSTGFCNYDWMVDEIVALGRIVPRSERIATQNAIHICSKCNKKVKPRQIKFAEDLMYCPECHGYYKMKRVIDEPMKMTEEIFSHPECPESATGALVAKDGCGYWFTGTPKPCEDEWEITNGKLWSIPDLKFDASEWKTSVITNLGKELSND